MDMTNLTTRARCARHNLTVYDDASAHARAEGNRHQILMPLAAAFPHLSERRHIGVVAALHAHPVKQCGKFLLHVHLFPAQVNGFVHNSAFLHRPRHTDANAGNFLCRDRFLRHLFLYGSRDIGKNFLPAVFSPGGNLPLLQNVAFLVK